MSDDELPRGAEPHAVAFGELPELTRGLRALGSARRGASVHDAATLQSTFFRPLLDARRKAADARDVEERIAAFEAVALGKQLDRVIERIVTEWPDVRASARRAVRAQLQERVAEYSRALSDLARAADELRNASDDTRLQRWRAWTVQLAVVFESADRCWISLRSTVESLPKSK
jgi:hypothetical protein